MLLGIVNLITGKRLIIYLLFINGLIFFGNCILMISDKILIRKSEEARSFQMIWVGISAILFGLIGGLLCSRFYRFGVGIMGLLVGLVIGEVISYAVGLENKWVLALSWSLGIVLGIISVSFIDVMIVINTTFIGAQAFMLGVDYIANKGYAGLIRLSISMMSIVPTPALWGMLASSILLNLLGMLIQYKAFKNTQYYKIDIKK